MCRGIQGQQIRTRCYDSFLSSGGERACQCLAVRNYACILKINLSVILKWCVCVCEGCVLGNEKAGCRPVSFPAKSTESPISDSGHTADLLMETDGLSSGVYSPPPSTATPHPLISHHREAEVTTNTTENLDTAAAHSLSFTESDRH